MQQSMILTKYNSGKWGKFRKMSSEYFHLIVPFKPKHQSRE